MKNIKHFFVTKTYLPPKKEFQKYVENIWKGGIVTNHGPLAQLFETRVAPMLGVKYSVMVNNGTSALHLATRALSLKGEIITSSFSHPSTISAIQWCGCVPRLVDIKPDTLTIDPEKITKAITKKTVGILATNIYGIPCDFEQIKKIAKRHNLKVIYDNACGFGISYKGKPLSSYGDVSIISLNATKVFHSIEGGIISTNSAKVAGRLKLLRRQGFDDEKKLIMTGTNAAMSEINASVGLLLFSTFKRRVSTLRKKARLYDKYLLSITNKVRGPVIPQNTNHYFTFFPVIFSNKILLLRAIQSLQKNNIFPRRYYHPVLTSVLRQTNKNVPVAKKIADTVLCLPFYSELPDDDIKRISSIVLKCVNS